MLLGRSLKLLDFKLGCALPVDLLTHANVLVWDGNHMCNFEECKGLDQDLWPVL